MCIEARYWHFGDIEAALFNVRYRSLFGASAAHVAE
jgi:hypothetical protein